MDLSFKQVPLVLTTSRLLSPPDDSVTVKKRKLSECSDSSNTNSLSDKGSLNDRFLELNLGSQSRFPFQDDEVIKQEEAGSIHIPKPFRMGQNRSEESPSEVAPKKDDFFQNLIKISQTDISGISKYLNLDLNSKMHTWDKITSNSTEKEKFKMGSVFTSFLNSPFNLPFMMPSNLLSDSQNSVSTHSESERPFGYKGSYIGPLTQDQRQDKVGKYLEKKKNRKWKHIRYGIRKDLADKRERVQGRFVKTPKMFSHSEFMSKDKEDGKMLLEHPLRNNSDFGSNPMSLSAGDLENNVFFNNSATSM